MLPLSLLTAAKGSAMLIELKNGETFNGHLEACDSWMNITLRNVIQTNSQGERFFKLDECYIRGNNIKYLRMSEDVLDNVKEFQTNQRQQSRHTRGFRGIRGRGRGSVRT